MTFSQKKSKFMAPLCFKIFCFYLLLFSNAMALEIRVQSETGEKINGIQFPDLDVMYLDGEIRKGDAEYFLTLVHNVRRDEFGNFRIHLNSSGGSVAEAVKLAKIFDLVEVTAIVDGNRRCISACASILYLSSRIHLVTGNGLLGFHSCRIANTTPSSICNDIIADHVKHRGTPVTAIRSLLRSGETKSTPSKDDVVFLGAELACSYGLCGPPVYDPIFAVSTFDCSSVIKKYQKVICADLQLSRYEASAKRISNLLIEEFPETTENINLLRMRYFSVIEQCESDKVCILSWIADWRILIRSEYIRHKILKVLNFESDKPNFSEVKDLVSTAFYYCKDPEECGREHILDGTFELATENAAYRLALNSAKLFGGKLSEKELNALEYDGVADCIIEILCDTVNIKTLKLEDIVK